MITFYDQDRRGEIGSNSVVIIKGTPSDIPGYNLFFLSGILLVVAVALSKKIKKH